MARRARYWRVRSAVTQQVNSIKAAKVNAHAAFLKMASGQLPFLGLSQIGLQRLHIKRWQLSNQD